MRLGKNIHKMRKEKGWSLQELSERSGVSRAMLSKIEREEKNPTVQVACQIAEALEVTLSKLLGEEEKTHYRLTKKEQRMVYRDAETGFERHLLSMARGIEFILNVLPAGKTTGVFPAHKSGVIEHVVVAKGSLQAQFGDQRVELNEGDSIWFEANVPHSFYNFGKGDCIYYLVIDSSAIS
ncbi:helix-turn-helix domain-containing protein [Thermoflavimicrobium dichotomicum]|uniref:Cupin domain-containing protein n=1 Tax=Thermoflavimicrobium dichotomicum TaxID=46223 RepID=A0A1I3MFQ1_9BACL|nr:XRE family transcriptional regulator [Thermoflavimicrobium dichotomicum]SFI95526.1 Cupin domain-containing protein [Thermoflavimicrobium dichotomicum]